MRRLIRDISSVLIISGLLLLVDAGVTLIWQEPVTAVIAVIERSGVDTQFLNYHSDPLTALDQHVLTSLPSTDSRIAFLARKEQRQVATGDALGTIQIASIGINDNIIQGTDTGNLQRGPGHYPSTAFPGLGQTVAIAGHRTTYLAPFRNINKLDKGSKIVVTMPYGRFTYVVQYHQIVAPTALWVINNVGYDRLVLSACNPLYSAAQRIIVFARLQSVKPLGAALNTD
jgi:sortase A